YRRSADIPRNSGTEEFSSARLFLLRHPFKISHRIPVELRRHAVRRGKSANDLEERQRHSGSARALDFCREKSGADLDKIRSARNSAPKRPCETVLEIYHDFRSANSDRR